MNRAAMVFAILLTPVAATAAGLMTRQQACWRVNEHVAEMAECLKREVAMDPELSDKWWARSYIVSAQLLGRDVAAGKLTDDQARDRLTDLYTYLQTQDQLRQSRTSPPTLDYAEYLRAERRRSQELSELNAMLRDIQDQGERRQRAARESARPLLMPPTTAPVVPQSPSGFQCFKMGDITNCWPM